MSQLKLTDIASALKLSPATISKALKGYTDVNPQTRKKILAYTQKVGYKPQYKASSLRTGKSGVIGVILPAFNNLYFSTVLETLIELASQKNVLIIPQNSKESVALEKKHLETLKHFGVDAIFMSLTQETAGSEHLQNLKQSKIPIFLFDKISKQLKCPMFYIDDRKAAFNATNHLIEQGCRNIAHFRVSLLAQTSIDRFLGYREALDAAKIPFQKSLVYVTSHGTVEQGKAFVQSLRQQKIPFDGIFTINDNLAIGAIEALKGAGIDVPREVAVMGFSNSVLSENVSPSLSSVDQGPKRIAMAMFEAFQNLDKAPYNQESFKEIIPATLVIRESSQRLSALKT